MSIDANLFRIQTPQVRLIRKEKVRVLRMVRALIPFAEVKEIGSTAVAGVIGKQDLDVLIKVDNNNFGLAKRILDEFFSRNGTQLSNENIQGYRVDSKADISLQLVVKGSLDFTRSTRQLIMSKTERRELYERYQIHGRI